MKLSIIIPSHNSQKTIVKTIKSIYTSININKYNFEIIVVDDFSVDGTKDIIKSKLPTVRYFQLKEHNGAARARNKGILESTGNLLLFVDSDVWFNKSAIETIMHNIKDYDIIYPKINYENGQLMYPVHNIEFQYPHISACFLIKKNSLDKLEENFDENYETYLEDYDFFMRCKLSGLKAKYVENARVIHALKEPRDYSDRYYLEVRNLVYGYLKLGKYAKKSGLYNPFTISNLVKVFICGIFNFAWFNYQGYQRNDVSNKKIRLLFKHNNKIFYGSSLKSIWIFLKAVVSVSKNISIVTQKRQNLRKVYNI